jgi:hypothetical protein
MKKEVNNATNWNLVTYEQYGSNGPVISGITQFLNILMGPPAFSVHVATSCMTQDSNFFSGAIIYAPSLTAIPSTTGLGLTWNLYESSYDTPINVYNDVTQFINTSLTSAQAYYGKLSAVQGGDVSTATFFWYRDLASNVQNIKQFDVHTQFTSLTTWTIKAFSDDYQSSVAKIFVQVLDSLGDVRSQCAHIALDFVINSGSEAYGGILIPGALSAVPNATKLNGAWLVHTEQAEPFTAFQQMEKFLGNLTDAQICYGRLSLATDSDSTTNSTVSFWYQGLVGEEHHSDNYN